MAELGILIPLYVGRPVVNAAPCRSISPFDAAELPVHLEASIAAMPANLQDNPSIRKRIQDDEQSLKDDAQKAVEKAVEASLIGRLVLDTLLYCDAQPCPTKRRAPSFLHRVKHKEPTSVVYRAVVWRGAVPRDYALDASCGRGVWQQGAVDGPILDEA